MTDIKCPICSSVAQDITKQHIDGKRIDCPRCGIYSISRTADVMWTANNPDIRKIANASSWIREHPNSEITSHQISDLLTIQTPRIVERANKILLELEKRSPSIITSHSFSNTNFEEWLAISYSTTLSEVTYLFGILRNKGLVSGGINGDSVVDVIITLNGYEYLESLRLKPSTSQIGFCAMWFDKKVLPIWNDAIFPAIKDAGYDPKRIDTHEHNNRIDDEIIVMLRRSKFVIADFTGQRAGVYFEAGFALGLGLQVIWTCEKSELEKNHFDTRQYNFLIWEEGKLDEFKTNLQNRIEATLGRGTLS
jgi:hypothetical protein